VAVFDTDLYTEAIATLGLGDFRFLVFFLSRSAL